MNTSFESSQLVQDCVQRFPGWKWSENTVPDVPVESEVCVLHSGSGTSNHIGVWYVEWGNIFMCAHVSKHACIHYAPSFGTHLYYMQCISCHLCNLFKIVLLYACMLCISCRDCYLCMQFWCKLVCDVCGSARLQVFLNKDRRELSRVPGVSESKSAVMTPLTSASFCLDEHQQLYKLHGKWA